jgi:hypothetical protein
MTRPNYELVKRKLFLSMLLIALLALPALAVVVKQLYSAGLRMGSRGVGSAILIINQGNQPNPPHYLIRTFAYPNEAVVKVGLESVNGSWGLDPYGNPKQVVLCKNGDDFADDCTYGSDGNLYIEGDIIGPMYGLAGIDGIQFLDSLLRAVGQASNIKVVLNNGDLGSGVLVRQF